MSIYNRNLGRAYRAGVIASGQAIDEARASGRSTARILKAIAWCIDHPGQWLTVNDHPDAPQTSIRQERLANEVMSFATRLELKFFEKRTQRPTPRADLVTQIRCDMFTTNPWEIV